VIEKIQLFSKLMQKNKNNLDSFDIKLQQASVIASLECPSTWNENLQFLLIRVENIWLLITKIFSLYTAVTRTDLTGGRLPLSYLCCGTTPYIGSVISEGNKISSLYHVSSTFLTLNLQQIFNIGGIFTSA